MGETLFGAAQVSKVDAGHCPALDLCLGCADIPELAPAPARQWATTPPGARHHQRSRERPREYASSGQGGSAGTSSTARSKAARRACHCRSRQDLTEPYMEERRTVPVCVAGELDRSRPSSNRRGAAPVPPARRPPRSRARQGRAGRARPRPAPRTRAPMPARGAKGLREAKDRLGLAGRLDRRCERLRAADDRCPVRCGSPRCALRRPRRVCKRACNSSRSPGRIIE